MGLFVYQYVGPPDVAAAANMNVPRAGLMSPADVICWIKDTAQELDAAKSVTATFIVDIERDLWICDRRCEHYACARGLAVLSAGEMTFQLTNRGVDAIWITNQSTGYCPEPESWEHVSRALQNAGIAHPHDFDAKCEFRRCRCGQINIVKNQVFECGVCGNELPREWNFHQTQ